MVVTACGVLGVLAQTALMHVGYLLTTYPADAGMYPILHLMTSWIGWLIGAGVGRMIEGKGTRVIVVGLITYPIWAALSMISVFVWVTKGVEIIFRR